MVERPLSRFWELDFIRGVAVVMMVFYHLLYDLSHFGGYSLAVRSGFWIFFAYATATIFMLLAGVSLTLSASKARRQGSSERLLVKFLKRGLKIFSLGMGITLVTYLLMEQEYIVFGALHLIGISTVLALPFLNLRAFNLFAGTIFILFGLYLQDRTFNIPWLIWLGLAPQDFSTLDYFPVFPWFGALLLGIFLGDIFYQSYQRRIDLPDLSGSLVVKLFGTLGRNSLLIYLVHQPVLIAILFLSGAIPSPLIIHTI